MFQMGKPWLREVGPLPQRAGGERLTDLVWLLAESLRDHVWAGPQ